MTGARLFLPPEQCGMIIDMGDDFPQNFYHELLDFGKEMFWFRAREAKTTRALNIYSGSIIG